MVLVERRELIMSHDLTTLYKRLSHDNGLQGESNTYLTKRQCLKIMRKRTALFPIDAIGFLLLTGKIIEE